jgi:uncharacterized protein
VKWLLAGASGFLGTAIRVRLASEGEQVVRLVRREPARYGTTSGVEPHTEESPAAVGFLAQVTTKWEAATQPASDAGVRVVIFRTSPVMDASGGSLVPMKLAWWSGLGAVIGDGSQRMPMISLRDYLAVMHWAATNDQASGPYNLTLREPTTNAEFSDALAKVMHRPRFLRVPAPVIRAALGELAGQIVGDMYVVPRRLTDNGFLFSDPTVEDVVASALGLAARH